MVGGEGRLSTAARACALLCPSLHSRPGSALRPALLLSCRRTAAHKAESAAKAAGGQAHLHGADDPPADVHLPGRAAANDD